MRRSLIGVLVGMILVGLAVAQQPATQPPATQPPTTQSPGAPPGTQFRGRGGFIPAPPDASGRRGAPGSPGGAQRSGAAELGAPPLRNFPPLPESGAGKVVMLEILLADVSGPFEN